MGYGATTTMIHEVGHMLGLAHPQDALDYESGLDYSASEAMFIFAWSAHYSNTAMSYLFLNDDFSQFNRDALNRYGAAAYINIANKVLPLILAKKNASRVAALLQDADNDATTALAEYGGMNYLAAATHAKAAYEKVIAAANDLRIPLEPQAWPNNYDNRGSDFYRNPRFVDENRALLTAGGPAGMIKRLTRRP